MEYNLWGNRKFHLELKSLILFLWVTLLVVSLFKCFSVPHEQAIWFLLSSFNVSLHVSGNNTTLNATSPPNQIKIGEIPSLGDGLVNITDPLVPSYNVKIPDMEEDPEPVEKVLNDSRQENATISGGMREKRKEENRVLDKQFSLSPLGSPLLDSFKNGLVPTSSHKQFLLSPLGSPLSDSFKNGSVPTSSQLNPFSFNLSQLGVQVTKDVPKSEISEPLGNGPPISQRNLTIESVPLIKYTKEKVSVVQKKNPMVQSMSSSSLSGSSFRPMKPRWSSPRDKELLSAKEQIQNAPLVKKDRDLYPPVFQNISMFKRSYELMERMFKIYIYQEGEKPIFHQPLLTGIYASEGWFMKLMEANKQFVVKDPKLAHMFYLPYSSRQLQITLYVPNTHMMQPLSLYLKYYVDMIAEKYPFWNRTGGSDHFLVACHDWAPSETKLHPELRKNTIKVLCNADSSREIFKVGKDITLPEVYVRVKNPVAYVGGKPVSQRPILAFFAGQMHGKVRPILLKYWENKDPDMKILGPKFYGIGKKGPYIEYMKLSKYCICPKGYEVNSPRVMEAIYFECVPVIISDNFVLPFDNILNWKAFSVVILERDIPRLKEILLSISEKRYLTMQARVKRVQKHFLWHNKPVKYDLFHMILHSIWHNRIHNMRL